MWLRSIFLKSLRDHRIAVLGWGLGMGLVVAAPMASVGTLVATPQARQQLVGLAGTFAWNADVVAIDTIGGYATFKIGIFIFLIAIWPILAAGRMLRGEEDRGSMDALLALPVNRVRLAAEKLAAMWVALLAMGFLVALVAYAGGRTFGADFGVTDALLFGFNLALVSAVFGGLCLLVAQFTNDGRTASGVTASILLVFIVLDMARRVVPDAAWVSRLSPIYYYNLSKPLVPGYGVSSWAMGLLLGLAVALSGAGVWLFAGRDVGGVVPLPKLLRRPQPASRPGRRLPGQQWSLRSVYARALGMIAWPTAWWSLGIAGFAAWMMVAVQQMSARLTAVLASPSARTLIKNLGGGAPDITSNLLSAIFSLLPLLLMAFVVTQVSRWSADEQEGRLDLVLATPQSRLTVVLGRYAAVASATITIALVTLLASATAAAAIGLSIDGGRLAAASLGMIPLGLLVAALGYLASGWLRTAADTGLLSFILLAWFLVSFIGPELRWPDVTLRLSALYYYGAPMVHGLDVGSMLGLVVVSAMALGVAAMRFSHKDIGV